MLFYRHDGNGEAYRHASVGFRSKSRTRVLVLPLDLCSSQKKWMMSTVYSIRRRLSNKRRPLLVHGASSTPPCDKLIRRHDAATPQRGCTHSKDSYETRSPSRSSSRYCPPSLKQTRKGSCQGIEQRVAPRAIESMELKNPLPLMASRVAIIVRAARGCTLSHTCTIRCCRSLGVSADKRRTDLCASMIKFSNASS